MKATGTTTGGFSFEYDSDRLDDMRLVDELAIVTDPESGLADTFIGASKILTMLLGKEQKKALYTHIGKKYEGRVPRADLQQALFEIMQAGSGEETVKN